MADYPFERLLVYNVIPGTTEVYWELNPLMKDPGVYTYQLQINRTSNQDDPDWKDVGSAKTDVFHLSDSENAVSGYKLDKYYRIILKTDNGTYISPVEGCFGQLKRYEWKLYQEIVRKERLRHKRVSVPGVLLKRRTSGAPCPHCTASSGGSTNSSCTYCYGTGYAGGYYSPYPLQMMDFSVSQKKEVHESGNIMSFNIAVDKYQGRALGIPELNKDDVWVDKSTGQRFTVETSPVVAQIRRVPAARMVELTLLPSSDMAYSIPIEDNPASVKSIESEGCGYVLVDHNYPSINDLRYMLDSTTGIPGATITIYPTGSTEAVFSTTTDINGRWNASFKADIGFYTIVFEKVGQYGPDTVNIQTTAAEITEQEQYDEDQAVLSANYTQRFW